MPKDLANRSSGWCREAVTEQTKGKCNKRRSENENKRVESLKRSQKVGKASKKTGID